MCFHICTCIFTYINTHMYVYKFSSISQSCPTLCDPTDCSMPGFPVHHQLPELTQTMSIDQWCHLSISSSVIPRSSCLQSLPASRYVQWVSALHQMAKVYWSFSFSISASNEYSGLISFYNWLVWSPCCPRGSQESSPALQFKSISSSALSFLYGPTLTTILDYWKNHTFT